MIRCEGAHTVGRWKKDEDWDALQPEDRAPGRRADGGEVSPPIASTLNDAALQGLGNRGESGRSSSRMQNVVVCNGERSPRASRSVAAILDRAQKGQRLARGLSLDGKVEEQIRAEAESLTIRGTGRCVFIDIVRAEVRSTTDRPGTASPGRSARAPANGRGRSECDPLTRLHPPGVGSEAMSALPSRVRSRKPTTRALSEPLADWALRRVRLDGRGPSASRATSISVRSTTTRHAHIVLSKAAQIGGTTWAILKAFHACVMGLNVMYFFPTRTDVLEFSKSRVGPLLQDNPFLGKLLKDTDTAGLKRIGDAHLYLRGCKARSA